MTKFCSYIKKYINILNEITVYFKGEIERKNKVEIKRIKVMKSNQNSYQL